MTEIVFTILIIAGLVLVSALVFGGWLIVAIVRLISRALGGGRSSAPPAALPNVVRCAHAGCRAVNPGRARFCRRCGKILGMSEPAAPVRRVAMW